MELMHMTIDSNVVSEEQMPTVLRLIDAEMEHATDPMPFALMSPPPLAEVKVGEWEVIQRPIPTPLVRGYFRGLHEPPSRENWLLVHHASETMWMSIAPMELESQSHHVHAARGRVLVGGLGLGAILWALLEKPEVDFVLVVEKEASVMKVMQEVTRERSEWHKHLFQPGRLAGPRFQVFNMDLFSFARDMKVTPPVDFALVDIWPAVGDKALRPDLQRLHRGLQGVVGEWAAWGLEMDFMSWRMEQKLRAFDIKPEQWAAYSEAIGVPLIGRSWRWMSRLAVRAVVLQVLGSVSPIRGEME